jgi:hypothetical protein
MEKLKKFTNQNQRKNIVLSSLNHTWQNSKTIIQKIRDFGFEWRGLRSRYYQKNRSSTLTEIGKIKSLSYYLSNLSEVESRQAGDIKEFRLK